MARAFRKLIELLDARRRRRLRLCRRGRGGSSALRAPPNSEDRGGSSALRAPPNSEDRGGSSALRAPPTSDDRGGSSALIAPPTSDDRPAPHPSELLRPPMTGASPQPSEVKRTQKRQLVLERKIVDLAVKHNQGTVLERLHAPKVDPLTKIVRVSTRMEVKIASWLLNSNAWQFKVAVWGHVTDEEFGLLLQEARNEGLTLYHLWSPHN